MSTPAGSHCGLDLSLSGSAQIAADTQRLLDAVSVAPVGTNRASSELRSAVRSYATAVKSAGLHAEHAVIRLKGALDAAGFRHRHENHDALIDTVITLCINEYYRD